MVQSEIQTQDRIAQSYEEIRYRVPYSRHYHDWLLKSMLGMLQPSGLILDDGCGNGYLSNSHPDCIVCGIDISAQMTKKARNRLDHVLIADAQHLPFTDGSFDAVFARGLIHHLPDPAKGIAEINRVLKNSSRVIFLDTHKSIISYLPRRLLRSTEKFSELHLNLSRRELEGLINRSMKIIRVVYVGYIGYILMGFPDVFNLYKYMPLKRFFTPLLIKIDEVLAKVPLLNRLSLGIIILAEKSESVRADNLL